MTPLRPQLDLADRLRELRTRRRLSLEDVAQAIGSSPAHLSALENRRIENPGYKTLLALAHYYQVSIIELIGPEAHTPSRLLSFEEAIEHLRWHASPTWKAAIVEMAQLMLNQKAPQGHSNPDTEHPEQDS
jgi:transcriptional regulator with XRE-family HTH domain